ncbi:acyl-CoA-binding domain-containing protein 6 isoform X4 [Notamacropus eugenii]|uniref:acyl-CoA-binding domain-containing protein 6 isoform X4 n=1 Tax=Notamacropus eugenii TaxID=9315 RepID=UPI003B670B27
MASPYPAPGATTGDSGGELSSGDESGDVGDSPAGPDREPPDSLAELFEKAAAHLQGLVQVASREQLLYLYARSKLEIVIHLNQASLILRGNRNGKHGRHLEIQVLAKQCRNILQWLKNWIQTGTLREEDKNIFDYCRENNIDHITKAIRSKKVDVNMKDEEGRALLHWACDRGHKDLVKVLLQYTADINCQDNEGQTALHYASACEFLDIVELLLKCGADPTLRDQEGCLPEEVTGCKAVSLILQQHTAGKA